MNNSNLLVIMPARVEVDLWTSATDDSTGPLPPVSEIIPVGKKGNSSDIGTNTCVLEYAVKEYQLAATRSTPWYLFVIRCVDTGMGTVIILVSYLDLLSSTSITWLYTFIKMSTSDGWAA